MPSPLTPSEFASLMARLGPFEPDPVLAVAVSGGADSMALALLADQWARAQGGRVEALIVDHGLRPESAAEAARVGQWLTARGISHHVLVWQDAKPLADIQSAARKARYELLELWCRSAGIMHLLLGHHRRDQAETVLLRLGRGSGIDGLAAMAPLGETAFLRLLRPLLDIDPDRLKAGLRVLGQDWIDDPSNRNPAYGRARLRALLPALAGEGMSEERLAATARRMGRARASVERAIAEAAARHVTADPAGFAVIEAAIFRHLTEEVGLRLLARLVTAVGGRVHPPRLDRLEALYAAVIMGLDGGRTLGGCRIVPEGPRLTICREFAKAAPPVELVAGGEGIWDGRFRFRVSARAEPGLRLGALGERGWRMVCRLMAPIRPQFVPACVRPGLPSVWSDDGVSAVPHLGYNRPDVLEWIEPAPSIPLTVGGRCLV